MSLPDGGYEYISPAITSMFGYPPKDWYEKPVLIQDIIHPDWHSYFEEQWGQLLKGNVPPTYEYQIVHKNGGVRWINQRNVPVKDDKKRLIAIEAVVTDITERKLAEEYLRESEQKYRTLFQDSNDGIILHTLDGKILDMNEKTLFILGYKKEELLKKSIQELHPDSETEISKKAFKEVTKKGHTLFESKFITKDEKIIEVSISSSLIDKKNGIIQGIARDITQLKKLEAQLIQAQKMESIGKLAGGIAHDFNNILYPILGFTQMSIEDLPEDHPVQENLQDVLAGAKRARDLVKQILLFSRKQEKKLKPTLLKPVIEETLKLMRSTIPVNIEIKTKLHETGDYILCDKSEINEIVMNLCTNAYHSIEGLKGVIEISLEKRNPPKRDDIDPIDHLCLSVKDNGVGIPNEHINQIFEPYFTTKDIGKGSGLGLSVVHGIVENYNGKIQIQSTHNKGTRFDIFLPITIKPESQEEQQPKKNPLAGTEEILFVDDEKSIVKFGVRSLERMGYSVTGMENSEEALSLFKSDPDKFDLVITDMAMPELVGTEMAIRMLEIRRDIPIILCSGYSDKVSSNRINELNIQAYIDKPIKKNDLLAKVRKILDQSRK